MNAPTELEVLSRTVPAHDVHALLAMVEVIAAKHEWKQQLEPLHIGASDVDTILRLRAA